MGILEIFFGNVPLKFNDPEFPFDYIFFGRREIDIWYYNLDRLGRVIGLAITYTNIQILLDYISKLKYLEELYLYNCEIDTFPRTFANLTNLKKLYIDKCRIKKIPVLFRSFKNLEELSLWENYQKLIYYTTLFYKHFLSDDLSAKRFGKLIFLWFFTFLGFSYFFFWFIRLHWL